MEHDIDNDLNKFGNINNNNNDMDRVNKLKKLDQEEHLDFRLRRKLIDTTNCILKPIDDNPEKIRTK